MKNKASIFVFGVAVWTSSLSSGRAGELLTNGNFESPAQSGQGNHFNVIPTPWIIGASFGATMSTVADANLVVGTVTTGTGVTDSSKYLPICPDDKTPGADQSFDGNGVTAYVSQGITLSSASALDVKIDFGGRDSTSGSAPGSFWQLLNSAGTSVLSAPAVTPATGSWVTSEIKTTPVFPAGNYTFIVTLYNPDMIDAASITTVPEPSTFAAAGLGVSLLGWMGFKRRRRG